MEKPRNILFFFNRFLTALLIVGLVSDTGFSVSDTDFALRPTGLEESGAKEDLLRALGYPAVGLEEVAVEEVQEAARGLKGEIAGNLDAIGKALDRLEELQESAPWDMKGINEAMGEIGENVAQISAAIPNKDLSEFQRSVPFWGVVGHQINNLLAILRAKKELYELERSRNQEQASAYLRDALPEMRGAQKRMRAVLEELENFSTLSYLRLTVNGDGTVVAFEEIVKGNDRERLDTEARHSGADLVLLLPLKSQTLHPYYSGGPDPEERVGKHIEEINGKLLPYGIAFDPLKSVSSGFINGFPDPWFVILDQDPKYQILSTLPPFVSRFWVNEFLQMDPLLLAQKALHPELELGFLKGRQPKAVLRLEESGLLAILA